jgi:2'-hydroxyisoflavone reductase
MGELLDTCSQVAQRAPHWRWADASALASLGLQPWTDLPLWLEPQGEDAAFARTDVSAALAAGLHTRALADTVADTLAWHRSLPAEAQIFTKAGLTPEREAAALAALGALTAVPTRGP